MSSEYTYVYCSSRSDPHSSTPNTASKFTSYLSPRITLGSGEHQVALIKIIYPNSYCNLDHAWMSFYSFSARARVTLFFPSHQYLSGQAFVAAYNKVLGTAESLYYNLSFNPKTNHCTIDLNNAACTMKFSENLRLFSGFDYSDFSGVVKTTAPHRIDLLSGLSSMFIYTSVTANVNVGDTYAPLLSVAPFSPIPGTVVSEYAPQQPVFVTSTKNLLDHIEINIRNTESDYFPFAPRTTTTLLLAFRPRL